MGFKRSQKMFAIPLAAVLLCSGAGSAGAEEAVTDASVRLADSYVQPDYVEVERLKQTKEVIVITKEEIAGKGYKNVTDILNSVPSVNVGLGSFDLIDIRGQGGDSAARNIQVMLDGAPITIMTQHPHNNNYNYIPVDSIEKIEIIPGGGSVMYGAGAAGGVINITTNLKRLDSPQRSISRMWGRHQEQTTTINIGDKVNDKLTYQLSYSEMDKDLYFKNTYRNSEYLAGGLSYQVDPTQRLSFRYSRLREEGYYLKQITKKAFEQYGKDYTRGDKTITIGIDENGNKIYKRISDYIDADRALDMYSVNYAKNFANDFRLSTDIFYNEGYYSNNNLGQQVDHSTRGIKLKLDHAYGNSKQHSVLVGLDYYTQKSGLEYAQYKGSPLRKEPIYVLYDKEVRALYASNTLNYGKWSFVQGIRRDFTDWEFNKVRATDTGHDTYKSNNTALELAAAYRYNDTGNVYARYERGFTLPDGLQIADEFGRELRPTTAEDEKFDLYEIGLRDKIGISTVNVTAFYSETNNQIDRISLGSDERTVNLYNTKRRGADLSFRQAVGKWTFTEGYSYLKGRSTYTDFGRNFVEENGKKIRFWALDSLRAVPKHKFYLRAQFTPYEKLSLSAQYQYVGRYNNFTTEDEAKDNRIGSHKVVDFDAAYRVTPSFTVNVGVRNAFDEKYLSYTSAPLSGSSGSMLPGDERMYYLMTSYKF